VGEDRFNQRHGMEEKGADPLFWYVGGNGAMSEEGSVKYSREKRGYREFERGKRRKIFYREAEQEFRT